MEAMLLINIHSHLYKSEVIGFVSGYRSTLKSTGQQIIFIHNIYPGDPLEDTGEDIRKNVEIDPKSAENISQMSEERGQEILGWYHSHPNF